MTQGSFLDLLGPEQTRPMAAPPQPPEPVFKKVHPVLSELINAAVEDTLPAGVPTWVQRVVDARVFSDDGTVVLAEVLAFDGRSHVVLVDGSDDGRSFYFLPDPGPSPWPRMAWDYESEGWVRQPNTVLTDDGMSRADLEAINPWIRRLS